MEKQELIDLYIKARQVGFQLSDFRQPEHCFDGIQIDENCGIDVKFSYYSHGETDYDTVSLTFEDLQFSVEDIGKNRS